MRYTSWPIFSFTESTNWCQIKAYIQKGNSPIPPKIRAEREFNTRVMHPRLDWENLWVGNKWKESPILCQTIQPAIFNYHDLSIIPTFFDSQFEANKLIKYAVNLDLVLNFKGINVGKYCTHRLYSLNCIVWLSEINPKIGNIREESAR